MDTDIKLCKVNSRIIVWFNSSFAKSYTDIDKLVDDVINYECSGNNFKLENNEIEYFNIKNYDNGWYHIYNFNDVLDVFKNSIDEIDLPSDLKYLAFMYFIME